MPLTIGSRFGPYEVQALLGAGGMGEVYRARDTKLQRDVALKILPDAFANDPERLARFEREARTLAALNHPHIAQIYGFEQGDGTSAIVLELVEGEDLAERLKRGPLPLDETLAIAAELVDALAAAHDQGIIHRDLKPANIKVRPDGTIKVLDFGLAKALEPAPTTGATSVSISPTITAATQAGVILGTAAYMSPEQARGKRVDKRTDIWAFGCVLFEMLAGRRAFGAPQASSSDDGEEITDVLASIITKAPDWDALPPATPSSLRKLLRRCLEKDRKRRLADVADARFEIEEARTPSAAPPIAATGASARARALSLLPWLLAAAILAAFVVTVAPWRSLVPGVATRLLSDLGTDASLVTDRGPAFALSPDGRVLAFVAQPSGGFSQLYIRRLEQLTASPLAGTAGARNPFFSPDGQWIAFFADRQLKKIPVTGGDVRTLCDVSDGRGGTWSRDGTIIFAPSNRGATRLQRVSDAGGVAEPITESIRGELVQRFPQLLPGGKAVLYSVTVRAADYETAKVVVQPLPTDERRVLRDGGYFGRYLASGHLLYMHEGTLFAQPFDVDRLETTGAPMPLLENVAIATGEGAAHYAVSEAGTFVYLPGAPAQSSSPVLWMDRSGRTMPLRAAPSRWSNPRFSPDGTRPVLDITDNRHTDISIYDLARDQLLPLSRDSVDKRNPVWAPDGSRIVFAARRPDGTGFELYWQRADGSRPPERLLEGSVSRLPGSWHPSGKLLAYSESGPGAPENLMMITVEGDEASGWRIGKPQPLLVTRARQLEPAFSPDGHWIAYTSDLSGGREVYVRSFPDSGRQWPVSTSGGQNPVWSRTARELFYWKRTADLDDSGELYAVSYRVDGPSLVLDRPRLVNDVRIGSRLPDRAFDLHPDGQRFAVAPAEPPATPTARKNVVVVFNSLDELKRLAPAAKH